VFSYFFLKEATAFGAALAGWMLNSGKTLEEFSDAFSINKTVIQKRDFGNLGDYENGFNEIVRHPGRMST